ncbi:MAG: Cys-tRNA(Pro) deacylase [Cocleimonas sp.]|nr:Cys-tRNA(Pro) deacylase [Cocleimonas sp.]
MTPAINTAKNAKIAYTVHRYDHDPSRESYGLEAADKLGVSEKRVFKTLVVKMENKELVVGIVPVSSKLNMKLIAKVLGFKKATMAEASAVERSSGYVLGGVSPLGQKKTLKTIVDSSALELPTIFVSAGRRGLEIELKPEDLLSLVKGTQAKISI